MVAERLAVGGAAVARAEAAARDADVAGERRAGSRWRARPCQPPAPLCMLLPPSTIIAGVRRRVAAGEGDDPLGRHAGDLGAPTPGV